MYITRIDLRNIRCFDNLSINLEENNKPILWTLILGDNSVGKSCLLKSIALGLCDEANAAALMKEIPGTMIKEGETEGHILITFQTKNGKEYQIITGIKRETLTSPESVVQVVHPEKNFPWNEIFICGYGVNRAIEANKGFEKYNTLDSVFSLFRYDEPLQNPELILLRQDAKTRKIIIEKLEKILMLDKDEYFIKLTKTGIKISGPWGIMSLGVLSEGYRSTTYWVLDFIGWQIYSEKKLSLNHNKGIVLIDEMEQHLHALWQRYFAENLRNQFQKTQFITTTHSPLIALGVADIENTKIIKLEYNDKGKIVANVIPKENLVGMRADQVLTSEAFGLPIAHGGKIGDKMTRFQELFLKKTLTSNESDTPPTESGASTLQRQLQLPIVFFFLMFNIG